MRKLYRSRKNKKIFGVCGGLAKYLGIDPLVIRLIWVILLVVPMIGFFVGVLVYLVCGLVIPQEPDYIDLKDIKEIED